MLPPLPRCSSWAYSSLISPGRISLPRKGCRVGLHIVLFEACSAFTRVAACTLARSPIRDPLPEGFRHFVASMPAPVASGWSESPGGACTHWKAPPCLGAHPFRSLLRASRAVLVSWNLSFVLRHWLIEVWQQWSWRGLSGLTAGRRSDLPQRRGWVRM